MKMPLGRPNCVQIARNVPLLIENLHAVVVAVADEEAALRVHRQRVRIAKLLGPVALLAPGLEILAVGGPLGDAAARLIVRFDDVDLAVGGDEHVGRTGEVLRRIAGDARLADVMRSFPSGLNLSTAWPVVFAPCAHASLIQTLPCGSTSIPCGQASRPAPKLRTSFPSLVKSSTGSTLEPTQVLAPQRSATQMLPSAAMSTALVEPHVRPAGSSPHE